MTNILPANVGSTTISGAVTGTVVQAAIPANYFGVISVELIAELAGNPAVSYLYQKNILVSNDSAMAVIRDASAVPTILDPASRAPVITIDTSSNFLRLRFTGFAGEDWNAAGSLSGMERARVSDDLVGLLAQAQDWYEADFSDVTIDATGEPQVFTTIPNHGQLGGTFGHTGANRPAVGNIESASVLRKVAAFNGSATYHFSSLAAAARKFTTDGSGSTVVMCVRPSVAANTYLASNCDHSVASTGFVVYYGVSGAYSFYLDNGGGVSASLNGVSIGTATLNGCDIIIVEHSSTRTPNCGTRLNGVESAGYNYAVAPGTGNPSKTLWLGATNGPSLVLTGDICFYASFNTLLSANPATRKLLEDYLAQKYQRPSAVMRQAPTLWVRPSLSGSVTSAAGAVSRVVDLSGKAHDTYQATAGAKPTLSTLGGQISLNFNGTSNGLSVGAGVGWSANTSHSFIGVLNPDQAALSSVAYQTLFDDLTGRLVLYVSQGGVTYGIERAGAYDSTTRNFFRAVTGNQIIEFATGATDTAYRNGVLTGSASATARAISGQVAIGAQYDISTAFAKMNLGEFIHRDTQLTGTSLWEAREDLVTRYGLTWNSALIPDSSSLIDPGVDDSVQTAGGLVSRIKSQHAIIDVIADGSMEAAGVTAWTAVNSATLTKSATTPYAGSQSLQIAYDGSHANPYARQTIMTAAQTYRLRCQMWGDGGSGIPKIKDSTVTLFTGTNTAAWQPVDVTFVATGTTLDFGSDIAVAGYVRLDSDPTVPFVENITAGMGYQFSPSTPKLTDLTQWTTPTAVTTPSATQMMATIANSVHTLALNSTATIMHGRGKWAGDMQSVGGWQWFSIGLSDVNGCTCWVDLVNGVVGTQTFCTATIASLGGGVYHVEVTSVAGADCSGYMTLGIRQSDGDSAAFVGDVTKGLNATNQVFTQAQQPTHEPITNDISYDGVDDYIKNGSLLNSAACSYGMWVNLAALPASEKAVFGGSDGTRIDRITIDNAGLIKYYHGTVAAASIAGFTTGAWHYLSNGGDSTNQRYQYDSLIQQQANATTSCTTEVVSGCSYNSGIPQSHMAQKQGNVNVHTRILSVREQQRIIAQQNSSNGYALSIPTAYTPSNWYSQIDFSWDPSVTTAGGSVASVMDRLELGRGATSPGVASTWPVHSVVDNSISSIDGTQYTEWIVLPNLVTGTIEGWVYVPATPITSYTVVGSITGAVTYFSFGVNSNPGFSFIVGDAAHYIAATTLNMIGWHHFSCTWNAGTSSVTFDGVTYPLTGGVYGGNASSTSLYILGRHNGGAADQKCIAGYRVAKLSIKDSAISVAQSLSNYIADYDRIVNKVGV